MRETINSDKNLSQKVGILKIKTYRPFPTEEINKILTKTKNVAVIEKAISLGQFGPLFSDIKAGLNKNINVSNFIVGLGGRDITQKTIREIIKRASKTNDRTQFIQII
jgi:pyruvate ferredoxin oxidoreductase alpha subunit